MTIVVYSSHTGSTEKYAKAFASRMGYQSFSVDDKDLPDDRIVFFGWLKGKQIVGFDKVNPLRVIAIGLVALQPGFVIEANGVFDKSKYKAPIYHLMGWIDRKKLNIFEKIFLYLIAAMLKLKEPEQTRQTVDVMLHGGTYYDESGLDQLCRFCEKK